MSDRSTRHLPDQPPPTDGDGPALWDVLISREETAHPDSPLLPLMRERHELGVERYGRPLRAQDGRDHAIDALQELLDALVYLEGARSAAMAAQGVDPGALRVAQWTVRSAAIGLVSWIRNNRTVVK